MERPNISRRKLLITCMSVTAGAGATVAVLPSAWRKPVVDAVLLPAHAQASGGIDFASARLTGASSEPRTPSGGAGPEPSLSQMSFSGCTGVPGAVVTCTFDADLTGTAVPLGSSSVTSDATGSFTATVNVPVATVAPIAAISFVTISCTSGGVTSMTLLFPSDISPAVGGSPLTPAAC